MTARVRADANAARLAQSVHTSGKKPRCGGAFCLQALNFPYRNAAARHEHAFRPAGPGGVPARRAPGRIRMIRRRVLKSASECRQGELRDHALTNRDGNVEISPQQAYREAVFGGTQPRLKFGVGAHALAVDGIDDVARAESRLPGAAVLLNC